MHRSTWFARLIGPCIVLASLVVIVSFLQAPLEVVKLVGAPLQVLPTLLGITPIIIQQEVHTINLRTRPAIVTFTRPGNYAIYSDDQQILLRTGMLENTPGIPQTWISIMSVERGENIPGAYVARGAVPWDPLTVPGRPIMTFVIAEPGRYEIDYAAQSGMVRLAPDYTVGRELVILLAWAVQIAAVALIVVLLSLPRIRRRRQAQRQFAQMLDRKRAATEAYWKDKLRNTRTRE